MHRLVVLVFLFIKEGHLGIRDDVSVEKNNFGGNLRVTKHHSWVNIGEHIKWCTDKFFTDHSVTIHYTRNYFSTKRNGGSLRVTFWKI